MTGAAPRRARRGAARAAAAPASDAVGRPFAEHFAGDRAAERIFLGAGVQPATPWSTRSSRTPRGWWTGARMRRYLVEALPLGKEAVAAALDDAGLAAGDVGLFAVATCTGYATPGLDIRARRPTSAWRPTCSGSWSGTWAATRRCPAWARSATTCRHRPAGRAAVLRADRPARAARRRTTAARWSSHALFGDAAAAVVLEPGRRTARAAGSGCSTSRAHRSLAPPTT